MAEAQKRDANAVEPASVFDRFDRMFDEWMRLGPFRRLGSMGPAGKPDEYIRVDEYRHDGALVVRAEVPGIDPDKDVELTVSDGMLHIEAQRREQGKTEGKGYIRQELRYGSFARSLPLPEGITASDITASYKDGILEISIPAPEPKPARKIPIGKS